MCHKDNSAHSHAKVIGIRFSLDDLELLQYICEIRGENMSTFIRRVVRTEFGRLSFLSDLEKKALGLPVDRYSHTPNIRASKESDN